MKLISKILIIICILLSLASAIISILDPTILKVKDTNLFVGSLAVLAATISAWAAINVIERDDNNKRPSLIMEPDFSRYGLVQLMIRNIGQNPAYNISFKWEDEPRDEGIDPILPENEILQILLPNEKVLRNIGRGFILAEKKHLVFKGTAQYYDSRKRKYSNVLYVDLNKYLRTMDHVDEIVKANYEIQKIPDILEKLVSSINSIISELQTRNQKVK